MAAINTAHLSEDGTILHIHIPMHLRRRGGRKIIITPDGRPAEPGPTPTPAMPDDPMVRALVRARRWQTMLESGQAATIGDLATQEKVDASYIPYHAIERPSTRHRRDRTFYDEIL